MLMCVESMYVVGGCSVVAIEHGRYNVINAQFFATSLHFTSKVISATYVASLQIQLLNA